MEGVLKIKNGGSLGRGEGTRVAEREGGGRVGGDPKVGVHRAREGGEGVFSTGFALGMLRGF